MNNNSKALEHNDLSGFEFIKEMLDGNPTAGINFDSLRFHPDKGYIIIELLLCEAAQSVTPYTSHPKKYWNKNKSKFLSLWRVACDLKATLYLINYAKAGTHAENEVLLIKVLEMNEEGIQKEEVTKFTRSEFKAWFRELNKECLSDIDDYDTEGLICPNCRGKIGHSSHGFYCTNNCGMLLSMVYGTKIEDDKVKALLEGKECTITTKKGIRTKIVPRVEKRYKDGKNYINWQTYNA